MSRYISKKVTFEFNEPDYNNSNFKESTQVEQFYFEQCISAKTGKPFIKAVDPLIMLFNQERLSKLGFDGVTKFVESLMQQTNNPLSELRKNCSDADLLATIKSRHLQSPSEILDWSRYMSRNMKEFEKAVQNAKAELEQTQQIPQTASAE